MANEWLSGRLRSGVPPFKCGSALWSVCLSWSFVLVSRPLHAVCTSVDLSQSICWFGVPPFKCGTALWLVCLSVTIGQVSRPLHAGLNFGLSFSVDPSIWCPSLHIWVCTLIGLSQLVHKSGVLPFTYGTVLWLVCFSRSIGLHYRPWHARLHFG